MNKLNYPTDLITNPIEITIIILSWNSESYIKDCVESVFKHLIKHTFEVIIIDNNSKDGTKNILEQLSNQYKLNLVFNKKNNGVAKGRNQGIALAKGKFIVFLDVDTIVFPSAIDTLVQYMIENNTCGLVAPRLLSANGELQLSCQKFPTFSSKLFRRFPLKITKSFLVNTEMTNWHHQDTITIDWVIGACQMIRRDTIERVGLLDENIFYGPEDVDYCMRVWESGYEVVYHPESTVIHYEQRLASNQMFSKQSFYHFMGLCHYFMKYKYLFSTRRINRRVPASLRTRLK